MPVRSYELRIPNSDLSVVGRVLGLLALGLVLVLLLGLVVSNYSLTPRNAKLGLFVATAIVAAIFFRHAWQVMREILQRFGRARP
jgi:hypothetical protein